MIQKTILNYDRENQKKLGLKQFKHILLNLKRLANISVKAIKINQGIKEINEYQEKYCCPYCFKPRLIIKGKQFPCPHEVRFAIFEMLEEKFNNG